jgi:RimJ/RimL family protein N-acetyltransferase
MNSTPMLTQMLIPIDRVLVTKRCALRYPQLIDAPLILEALTHPLFPTSLPIAQLNTIEAINEAIRTRQDNWRNGFALSWCVEERTNWRFVGMVRIGRLREPNSPNSTTGRWTLSFWVHPASWRQGYATEFAQDAMRLAFAELGAEAIKASTPTWNVPSQALLERLGFIRRTQIPDGYQINGQPQPTWEYEIGAKFWRERMSHNG